MVNYCITSDDILDKNISFTTTTNGKNDFWYDIALCDNGNSYFVLEEK